MQLIFKDVILYLTSAES